VPRGNGKGLLAREPLRVRVGRFPVARRLVDIGRIDVELEAGGSEKFRSPWRSWGEDNAGDLVIWW